MTIKFTASGTPRNIAEACADATGYAQCAQCGGWAPLWVMERECPGCKKSKEKEPCAAKP